MELCLICSRRFCEDLKNDLRFQSSAIGVLQEPVEAYPLVLVSHHE
jgi:hypothetical protein